MPCWLLLENTPRIQPPYCYPNGTMPPSFLPRLPQHLLPGLPACTLVPPQSKLISVMSDHVTPLYNCPVLPSQTKHQRPYDLAPVTALPPPSPASLLLLLQYARRAPTPGLGCCWSQGSVRLILLPLSILYSNANFSMTLPLTTLLNTTTLSPFPHSLTSFTASFFSIALITF